MLSLEAAPGAVAELSLFNDGPRPASVRVVEPVVSAQAGSGGPGLNTQSLRNLAAGLIARRNSDGAG